MIDQVEPSEQPVAVKPKGDIAISMQHVDLLYGQKVVLSDCSLDCRRGEVTSVIGLSGAGKSTILRLMNGLRRPQRGHVFVNGDDIIELPERALIEIRKKMGFAFQAAALFDSLTVAENVSYPLYELSSLSRSDINKRMEETLEALGLSDVGDRLPAELSGGMQKRVGFARAIVNQPEIILFDEPTTGLDPIMTNVITDTIKTIQSRLHATCVVVMHDIPSVYAISDNIALLFEGTIIASGSADEFRRSENPIIQQFLQGSSIGPISI